MAFLHRFVPRTRPLTHPQSPGFSSFFDFPSPELGRIFPFSASTHAHLPTPPKNTLQHAAPHGPFPQSPRDQTHQINQQPHDPYPLLPRPRSQHALLRQLRLPQRQLLRILHRRCPRPQVHLHPLLRLRQRQMLRQMRPSLRSHLHRVRQTLIHTSLPPAAAALTPAAAFSCPPHTRTLPSTCPTFPCLSLSPPAQLSYTQLVGGSNPSPRTIA